MDLFLLVLMEQKNQTNLIELYYSHSTHFFVKDIIYDGLGLHLHPKSI
jgi:hypothetical protein